MPASEHSVVGSRHPAHFDSTLGDIGPRRARNRQVESPSCCGGSRCPGDAAAAGRIRAGRPRGEPPRPEMRTDPRRRPARKRAEAARHSRGRGPAPRHPRGHRPRRAERPGRRCRRTRLRPSAGWRRESEAVSPPTRSEPRQRIRRPSGNPFHTRTEPGADGCSPRVASLSGPRNGERARRSSDRLKAGLRQRGARHRSPAVTQRPARPQRSHDPTHRGEWRESTPRPAHARWKHTADPCATEWTRVRSRRSRSAPTRTDCASRRGTEQDSRDA